MGLECRSHVVLESNFWGCTLVHLTRESGSGNVLKVRHNAAHDNPVRA